MRAQGQPHSRHVLGRVLLGLAVTVLAWVRSPGSMAGAPCGGTDVCVRRAVSGSRVISQLPTIFVIDDLGCFGTAQVNITQLPSQSVELYNYDQLTISEIPATVTYGIGDCLYRPVDGGWCLWGPCVLGTQTRTCGCPAPVSGGAVCPGPSSQACSSICALDGQACNIDGDCCEGCCMSCGQCGCSETACDYSVKPMLPNTCGTARGVDNCSNPCNSPYDNCNPGTECCGGPCVPTGTCAVPDEIPDE